MPLPAKGKLVGNSYHLEATTAIAAVAMAAAAPTKAEYDALATKFNLLLVELKSQGHIKA